MGLQETLRERRGHDFYPPKEQWQLIPRLRTTDSVSRRDKTIVMHYFTANADWWIIEADFEGDDAGLAFGYACIGGDDQNAEWGYVSLVELEELQAHGGLVIVERDLHWEARPAVGCGLPGRWH